MPEEHFHHVGSLELPEGYEGKELHFFVSRGRVEVWLLPPEPHAESVEAWLKERREQKC